MKCDQDMCVHVCDCPHGGVCGPGLQRWDLTQAIQRTGEQGVEAKAGPAPAQDVHRLFSVQVPSIETSNQV